MSAAGGKRKCVFLDRDGIVNERTYPGYIERWEDFRMLAPFPDVLRKVRAMGYVAVIITNQRGVGLGSMTQEAVDRIHANLRAQLKKEHGVELLDIICCPHLCDACSCRKPQPGMLLDAARRHGLDLSASWMIGDNESDVEAGRRAGCRTVLVAEAPADTVATICLPSMEELAVRIEDILAE
ncbi:MAG: HAD family hydrolase [Lentisphaerae bacterium]|nr:HAD family hydrolase [Lentisphaerota bacterium]